MDKAPEPSDNKARIAYCASTSGAEEMTDEAGDSDAWIDGAPARFDQAVTQAARWLAEAANPVFGHIGADVDGAREAVRLAERIGGVLDHAASAALIADLDPLRESGAFQTTPLEADVRADVALVFGEADADWLKRPARPYDEETARHVIRLPAATTGHGADRLAFLATLRARVKQRPVANATPDIDALAATLLGAKFGVALWRAAELEPLAVEAIHGLVRDLNETTRFSTLALLPPDQGLGVQNVCGWMTGFPLRTGFPQGLPEHDPWRYDARRLVEAGEADCLIWVSAFEGGAPAPAGVTLSLGAGSGRVRFAVAQPGVDYDAVLFDPAIGGFVATCASAASSRRTVAETLAAIRHALDARPC